MLLRPRAVLALRLTLVTIALAVFAFGALRVLPHWVEWAYPWTDQPFLFASLHIENDRSKATPVTWRPKPGVPWIRVLKLQSTTDREPVPSRNRLEGPGWLPVGPLIDADGDYMQSAAITVRIGESLLRGATEFDLEVHPGDHVSIRVAEDKRVFVSHGAESWIGSVSFGSEREVVHHDMPDLNQGGAR